MLGPGPSLPPPVSLVSLESAIRACSRSFMNHAGKFISFGGDGWTDFGDTQELVEQKRRISERRFLHALTSCMLLPEPEAQEFTTSFIGPAAVIVLFRHKIPIFPVVDACTSARLVLTLSKHI